MKIKYSCSLIVLVCSVVLMNSFSATAQTTNLLWAKAMGGNGSDESRAVTTDASGNVYSTGNFKGTVDFDPSPAATYTLTSAGGDDVFVVKLDASGNFVWARAMGGTANDYSTSIAVDISGNVYTTGFYYGAGADYDPGAGVYPLTFSGGSDIFVSKLDASGNFVWAAAFNGVNIDTPSSIYVDAAGNVYSTGYFFGTVDFDPGATPFNLSSSGGTDIYVSKLNASGSFLWAKKMGGSGGDNGSSVFADASGNVYTTGVFASTADFDPSPTTFNLISNGGGDIFVCKLDATGNLLWAKGMGGSGGDWGNSLAVDASGRIFVTGSFQSTVDFDPNAGTYNLSSAGDNDIFILSLDASGNFLLARGMGGTGTDNGNSIAVDAAGSIYTAGTFSVTADLDPSAGGSVTLTSDGAEDIFLSKLNAAGNFVWAKRMGSTGTELNYGSSLRVDALGNIYSTGCFTGTVDFDPDGGTVNLASAGGTDIFVHKMSQCDQWNQKANFGGTARTTPVGFSIGTKGYFGTGADGTGNKKDFWEYDPSTNAWTQKADFGGTARFAAAGFSIGTKGYIGTGYTTGGTQDFWEWEQSSNIWTQKTSFPGAARWNAVGLSINNKGYIGTGWSGTAYKDFWEYDPNTNAWTQKADFYSIRNCPVGFSIGTKGYIGTGSSGGTNQKDFWEWDQNTNTWSQKTDFPGTARLQAVGFSIGNNGYIGTGWDAAGAVKDFWEWNQATNAWSQKPDVGGDTRYVGGGFVIGSKGYIGLGYNNGGTRLQDLWEYTPACNTCSVTASINTGSVSCSGGNDGFATGTLSGGAAPYTYSWNTSPLQTTQTATGLATGNYSVSITDLFGCSATASVSISTATPNSWTQKANFGGTTRNGAVGFSIGAKGYIGTGYDGTYKKDFWEWDQATNVWTQKADFAGAARAYAVGFSIGTKGYIGTGDDGGAFPGSRKNDFWEWDQATNTWNQKANFGGTARSNATGFSIGVKGYIGTGNTTGAGNDQQDLWEWDQSTNTWSQKASLTGSARNGAVGFSIGNKGYIGMGTNYGISVYKNDFWEWNQATNTWSQKADFGSTARYACAAFSIGTKGYIGTGEIIDCNTLGNDFWEWNQATNSWTSRANVGPAGRCYAVGFSIGNKGYIGTGYNVGCATMANDFWEYAPTCNTCSVVASVTSTSVSCTGGNNGSASVAPSGGTSPYSYLWLNTPQQTTQTATGLSAGNYSVTVTDAASCSATATVSISQPAAVLSVSTFANTTICSGQSVTFNGTAATGGTPSYNYNWSPATSLSCTTCASPVASPTSTVTYTVTAADANSCTAQAQVTVTVNQPPAAPTAGSNSPVCSGTALSLSASTISGAAYSWNGPNSFTSSLQNPVIASATTLASGSYSVTATLGGCTGPAGTASVTVNQTPSAPTAGSNSPVNSGTTLSLTAGTISGATYNWSGPNSFTSAAQNPTIAGITTAGAGCYSVTATANGCTGAAGTTCVTVTVTVSTLTITTTHSNVSCSGGNDGAAAVVTVTGGTSPYTYSWNTAPVQTTQAVFNLTAGNYTVTVTDALGASATATVNVTQPTPVSVFTNPTNVSCFGGNNGKANAIAGGGTSPYYYSWNSFPVQTTATASNLGVGNYTVTVTDANGCTGSNTVAITQPAVLTVSMTIVNTDCGSTNGSAAASVSGGTPAFTYSWSNGGTTAQITGLASQTYTLTVTDSKGCTLSSPAAVGTKPSNFNLAFSGTPQNGAAPLPVTFTNSTPNLSNYNFTWYWGDGNNVNNNLATVFYTYNFAGTYDVSLVATSIANGCKDTLTKQPYINVTGTGCGYTVTATPSGPINKCLGDTVILTANTNAVAPFSYQWNIASVAISGATGSTLAVTQSGYYSVTVIKNNCPVTSSAVQVNFTTLPQQPVITSAGNIVPCLGGAVTLTSSAVSGVTYSWNTTPVKTTQSVVVTSSGNYIVTVTNTAGCSTSSAPFTVNGSLAQAPICLVTVDSASQHNIIAWEKQLNQPIDSFIVYREITTNNYKPIGAVPYDSLSLFVDTVRTKYFPNTGDPNGGTYRYKIAVRDTCGNYSPMSPYHNTIYIINNNGTFFWPQLYTIENSGNPVTSYDLMRDDNSTGNWNVVNSVAGTQQTVTDPNYATYQSTASWRVKTQWGISCTATLKNPEPLATNLNSSRSNVYRTTVPTSANEINTDLYVIVYPNPNNGIFSIQVAGGSLIGSSSIIIYNVLGEKVYSTTNYKPQTTKEIDLSSQPQGVYYLQISSADQTITRKIVIE